MRDLPDQQQLVALQLELVDQISADQHQTQQQQSWHEKTHFLNIKKTIQKNVKIAKNSLKNFDSEFLEWKNDQNVQKKNLCKFVREKLVERTKDHSRPKQNMQILTICDLSKYSSKMFEWDF